MTAEFLDKPYWIVDILPRQVPAHDGGQYFVIEEYLRDSAYLYEFYRHLARMLLKLNCYYELAVGPVASDARETNPRPKRLEALVRACPLAEGDARMLAVEVPAEGACLVIDGNDLNATLYGPSPALLDDMRALAASEGLFVWKP